MKLASAALIVVAAFLLIAADSGSIGIGDGLTVHEWGTFTSVAGEDGSSVDWDALGCSSDLPKFVNDFGYRNFKARLTGTVRMETPVIYFYSQRELRAHVKVAFPQGVITEWYPRAEHGIYRTASDGSVRRIDPNLIWTNPSMHNMFGAIEWNDVDVQPGTTPALPLESGPSHYYAARTTDSAPVAVGDEHEKFLFYRGVGHFAIPLSARVQGYGKVALVNQGQTIPVVFLFENRGGHIGFRDLSGFGEYMTVDSPQLNGSFAELRGALERALTAQGLFPKEAQAMVETWKDSWFEEGSRLIYVFPSAAVDQVLPLQIDPAPQKTSRVFVGRMELITASTTRAVESAIAQRDWAAIRPYRRFMDPILSRISQGDSAKMQQLREQIYAAGQCR